MRKNTETHLALTLLVLLLFFFLGAWFVQLSWNYAATEALTIANPIDYKHALVLSILAALLFGGGDIVNNFNTVQAEEIQTP